MRAGLSKAVLWFRTPAFWSFFLSGVGCLHFLCGVYTVCPEALLQANKTLSWPRVPTAASPQPAHAPLEQHSPSVSSHFQAHLIEKRASKGKFTLLPIPTLCHGATDTKFSLEGWRCNNREIIKCKLKAFPLQDSFLNAGQVTWKECQRKQAGLTHQEEEQGASACS